MSRHLRWFVGFAALSLVVIAILVVQLLRPLSDGVEMEGADDASIREQGQVNLSAPRPACPKVDLGADVDCLYAETAEPASSVVVVNVWSWWCAPCREELPLFVELANRHPEITVVGMHADTDAARGAMLLDDLNLDLPSFQDNTNAFAAAHRLPSVVPITVVFVNGTVRGTYPRTFESVEELEAVIP